MAQEFKSLADFHAHGFDTLIDVRSPAEYAEDHIPGAINLPVLSDEERARVGTIYKQENPFKAKKIGAALVAQNAAKHLQGQLAEMDGSWQPLVYCWRGGQRSGSFTSILKQIGWRADTITGGYQSYRRMVAGAMHDTPLAHRLVVLEGNTGTAKTEILHLLSKQGIQMVDLEGLANHRGSVFGAMDHAQPSQKFFEGQLAAAFLQHNPEKPVLVESESSKIGRLIVPSSIWSAMKTAPRIAISATLAERAQYLLTAYADILENVDQINGRLAVLIPHQGRERVEHWQGLASQGDFRQLTIELMEQHYDPSYHRSRASNSDRVQARVALVSMAPDGLEKGAQDVFEKLAFLEKSNPV